MGDNRPREGYSPHALVSPPIGSSSRSSRAGSAGSRQEEGRQGESSRHGHHVEHGAPSYHARLQPRDSISSRFVSDSDRGMHSSRQLAPPPPPLRSYIPADDRQFAFSDRYQNASGTLSTSGRHPSVPPPQRPVSSHAASQPSRSQPPPSPPSSRGALSVHNAQTVNTARDRYETAQYHPSRPLSPPASRGESHAAASRPLFHPPAAPLDMERSQSQTSHHSDFSTAHARAPSLTPSDQGDDQSSPRDRDNESSEPASGHGGPKLQRPKRTRVLMTHVQQQRLGTLWKRSKFPSTQEREEIAVEVGLTPRQVQVWFQNRRQTFRKQIQQNAIPHGSDPADYSDLQKSPRSRRLSLEAANAASDDRDRISRWAQSSSSSMDSYATRPHTAAPHTASSEPMDSIRNRGSGPGNPSGFAHSPPSPPRRYESDYRADYRHLPRSRQGPPSQYRPSTASSSSSYYGSLPSYTDGLARQYSLGNRGVDRRGSFWDSAIPQTNSPTPYSPPPTAQGGLKGHNSRIDGYGDGSKRRRTEHDFVPPKPVTPGHEPERPKTSHLPPSLAALAIARPLDRGMEPCTAVQLPGLALQLDGPAEAADPKKPTMEWPNRDLKHDYRDSYTRNELVDHRGNSDIRGLPKDVLQDGITKPSDLTKEAGPASSLPRFNDLFR